ncbi:MAG: hypothetical protein FJZ67_10580 [Bacteroidetes bacterium]|nr:hypothetical protein [Bacteroidota bacterium]
MSYQQELESWKRDLERLKNQLKGARTVKPAGPHRQAQVDYYKKAIESWKARKPKRK